MKSPAKMIKKKKFLTADLSELFTNSLNPVTQEPNNPVTRDSFKPPMSHVVRTKTQMGQQRWRKATHTVVSEATFSSGKNAGQII